MDTPLGDIRSLKEKYKKYLETTLRQPSHIASEEKSVKETTKKRSIPKPSKSKKAPSKSKKVKQASGEQLTKTSEPSSEPSLPPQEIDSTTDAPKVPAEARPQGSKGSSEESARLERKRKGKQIAPTTKIKIVRRTPPYPREPVTMESSHEHQATPEHAQNAPSADPSEQTEDPIREEGPPTSSLHTEEFVLRFTEGNGLFQNPDAVLEQFDNINIMDDEDEMDNIGPQACNDTLLRCALKCYFLGPHQQNQLSSLKRSGDYARSLAEDRAKDSSNLRKRLGAAEAEKASLQSEVEMLKNQLKKKDALLNDQGLKITELEKDLEAERGIKQELEATIKTTQDLRAQAIKLSEASQNQVQSLKADLALTQKHLDEADAFGKDCCATHLALRETISKLRSEVVKQRQVNHRLTERLDGIRDEALASNTVELYRQYAEGRTEHWDVAEAEQIYSSLRSIFEQKIRGELAAPFPPEALLSHVEAEFPLPTTPRIPHRISRSVVQSVLPPTHQK